MPVDWSQSTARSLHLSTLSIEDRPRMQSVNLDLSDDEDLREQMDLHSIIVSCISEEPLLTAEQVIEELEELMQDSPEMESERIAPHSELSFISQKSQRSHSSQIHEERVRLMSALELNGELEDVETAIRGYSEELIQHLAIRDELEFEKEVKNSFISVLIDVQNRQKVHREMLRKKRKVKNTSGSERLPSSRFSVEGISTAIQNGFRHTFGNVGGKKQYVTTVIPYERKDGPPSLQDLQIFTKILEAMRDDSDKVPSLLTDYILKESNSAAIEELKKQIEQIVQDLNLLKEQQALQTVCLKGIKIPGKCFLVDTTKKSFHAANDECIAKGGTLSSPLSGDENDQLYDYVRQTVGPEGHIWLGVNDILKEGEWTDQTGSPIRFKNWESEITHQPDGGRGQNCAILSSTANGKWFDEDCRGEKASVCQFNIV
ncbi:fasciculation and elongation protein zeta-2 isoform X3 [Onychostoma macrolepis]|nr:fasciculation and elongation protein zeta-2 isoform X3 [Onychostoma macrolepis]